MTSVTIGNGMAEIGYRAFDRCDNLEKVYYTGSEEQWGNIDIRYDNQRWKNAAVHCEGAVLAPAAAAEIVRTDSAESTEYTFTVPADTAYASGYVYVLVYDVNGALTGVSCASLAAGSTSVSAAKSANDALAKVIVWADTLQPLIKDFSV